MSHYFWKTMNPSAVMFDKAFVRMIKNLKLILAGARMCNKKYDIEWR